MRDACFLGKDAPSREAGMFPQGIAELHSSWKGWGGCPGPEEQKKTDRLCRYGEGARMRYVGALWDEVLGDLNG